MEPLRKHVGSQRAWTRDSLQSISLFYDVSAEIRVEIAQALNQIALNGLHLQNIEQEDFRIPSFARDVPALRDRLDNGNGFFILRGLDTALPEDQLNIVYWGLGNYLGRVIRQDLSGSRLDTVSDKRHNESSERAVAGGGIKDGGYDPYRVIDTNKFCTLHTDNAYSNPRTPDYLGLMCLRKAARGGESLLISAYTVHNEILANHPDFLDRLYQDFHWHTPPLQTLPGGPETKAMPIFEISHGDLVIHYLDMYLQPGMEIAGEPMEPAELEMQSVIDSLLLREDLLHRYLLQRGEILFSNNRWTLHGREAFTDYSDPDRTRKLARLWMWRRHIGPGIDPVALDMAELG